MNRAPPTDLSDIPNPDEITATVGPEEAIVFDADGHLTTIPARWWALLDRNGDPGEQVVKLLLEDIKREAQS
jgi:hypothetical protein